MAHTTLLMVDITKVVELLNALLRGEYSAIDTYQLAVDKLGTDAPSALFDCLHSHRLRAELLTERILDLRGRPAPSGGVWGAFAHAFAGGAAMLGRKAILAALEEGEDHGLVQYRDAVTKLDADTLRLVEQDLLPEQHRTHHVMSALLRRTA